MVIRNPGWQRDELILALDLYHRLDFGTRSGRIGQEHEEVVRLSELLNALPIHTDRPDERRFRNANGVYMKLCNFLAVDPVYTGKGLTAGGKKVGELWEEFKERQGEVASLAAAIRKGHKSVPTNDDDDEEEFPEGKIMYRLHRARERNRGMVKRKKAQVLKRDGKLACEACGFDFAKVYGVVGDGYIECHHNIPVSELEEGAKTRLSELSVVCANCHRMLHRKRPWITVGELAALL